MVPLFDRILAAHKGIRPDVPVSSLERGALLSRELDCDVWLKTEHLMPTGSFKVRGFVNKIRTLGGSARPGNPGRSNGESRGRPVHELPGRRRS